MVKEITPPDRHAEDMTPPPPPPHSLFHFRRLSICPPTPTPTPLPPPPPSPTTHPVSATSCLVDTRHSFPITCLCVDSSRTTAVGRAVAFARGDEDKVPPSPPPPPPAVALSAQSCSHMGSVCSSRSPDPVTRWEQGVLWVRKSGTFD